MSSVSMPDPVGQRSVGQLAATIPGATAVFRRHRLDFCCGGDVPLAEAAESRGIAIETITAELARLDPQAGTEHPQDTEALIDHIVTRYHDVHRRDLPELIRLALKVEAVHRSHPAVPQGLAETLEAIHRQLDVHMKREEEELFPRLRQAADRSDEQLLAELRHDHDEQGEQLHRMEAITHGFRPPEDACRTWQALYTGAARFVDDVMQHVHLENNVLFPRFG